VELVRDARSVHARHRALAALAIGFLVACSGAAPVLKPGDGMLAVPGGKIWYRVVGTGRGTPLLVIHGGPGGSSCRQRELARLGMDRPVIFYDQLGTGRSERPTDTTLWKLDRSVAEVQAIRDQLGLRQVDILGHSWGGTVAAEYALTHPNSGVRALILAGPLLSTKVWIADADSLVAQLPDTVRRVVAEADRTGKYDTPAYQTAIDTFSAHFTARHVTAFYPECATVDGNRNIYEFMWGPSEFQSTGTLRSYDRTSRLGEMKLPVLLIGGEYDEARPSTLREFQRLIPGSEVITIPNAGHALMVDAPEETAAAIRGFLSRRELR